MALAELAALQCMAMAAKCQRCYGDVMASKAAHGSIRHTCVLAGFVCAAHFPSTAASSRISATLRIHRQFIWRRERWHQQAMQSANQVPLEPGCDRCRVPSLHQPARQPLEGAPAVRAAGPVIKLIRVVLQVE